MSTRELPTRPGADLARASDQVLSSHRRARARGRRPDLALQAAVLVVVLGAWWLVTALRLVPPLYLPGPAAVWDAFISSNSCRPVSAGAARYECGVYGHFLWEHLGASLRRIGVGVGTGIVAGIVVGYVMASSRVLMIALSPYLNFVRALPPLGYIGLLIVWAGMGDASKYRLLFLAAFPPIVIATIQGVQSVTQDRIHAAQSLGASRLQTVTSVVLPSSLPFIVSGVRLATGFAWTTVVAAELNNGIPGIGGTAYLAGTQIQTALVIACIVVIGVVAVALDQFIVRTGRALLPWQGHA